MFDEMQKSIDAVFVAAPDHHHFLPAMIAMSLGKHVYVEKPLAHTIDEVRRMMAAAKKYKVVTQLGNQGPQRGSHPPAGRVHLGGRVGNVLETYSWPGRAAAASADACPRNRFRPACTGKNGSAHALPRLSRRIASAAVAQLVAIPVTAPWAIGAATTWTGRSWP